MTMGVFVTCNALGLGVETLAAGGWAAGPAAASVRVAEGSGGCCFHPWPVTLDDG